MSTIAEKIKDRRKALGMSQKDLGEMCGTTLRTINAIETGATNPRPSTLQRIAAALDVTVAYLTNPQTDDVNYGKEEEPFVEATRAAYGTRGAMDMQALLQANQAMLAGGDVPQEDKDAFFQAVMEAYMENRKKASLKFDPHKFGN